MFFKNSSRRLCCSFTFPATTSLYLGGPLILSVRLWALAILGLLGELNTGLNVKWSQCLQPLSARLCSERQRWPQVYLTHFLFSSSTSKLLAPKCLVGITIRSERISHPRKINVERSATDLGARMTLSEWSFAASWTGIHGALQFWTELGVTCPERREMVIFYRTDSRDRHS